MMIRFLPLLKQGLWLNHWTNQPFSQQFSQRLDTGHQSQSIHI